MYQTNSGRIIEKGFTLTELLVALFIFSLIGLTSWKVLSQSVKAEVQQSAKMDRILEIKQALDQMGKDTSFLVNIDLREDEFSTRSSLEGEAERLEFVRVSFQPAPEIQGSELVRIHYWVQRDPERGQILFRSSQSRIDGQPASIESGLPILSGIVDLRLEYLDEQLQTQSVWPIYATQNPAADAATVDSLPVAIKLTLELEDYGKIYRIFEIWSGQEPEVSHAS